MSKLKLSESASAAGEGACASASAECESVVNTFEEERLQNIAQIKSVKPVFQKPPMSAATVPSSLLACLLIARFSPSR